jgi:hypothetical protein
MSKRVTRPAAEAKLPKFDSQLAPTAVVRIELLTRSQPERYSHDKNTGRAIACDNACLGITGI